VARTPWSILSEIDLGGGHHPALLDEVLAALPTTPAQLEVKNLPTDPGFEPDHRLALETAARARHLDMVTGFNPEMLAAVRGTFPNVVTGLAIPADVSLGEAVKHCLDAGHRALVPHHSLIMEDVNADIDIYPWTVNDPARARELVEYGAAGIITDDPGLMNDTLRRDT
jgi:glycerophosphoryl diester phosphodiesterase